MAAAEVESPKVSNLVHSFVFRSIRYEASKTCPKAGERKLALALSETARIKVRTLELQVVFMANHSLFNIRIDVILEPILTPLSHAQAMLMLFGQKIL